MFDMDADKTASPWPARVKVAAPFEDMATLTGLKPYGRTVEKGQDVLRIGGEPQALHVLVTGLACRYRLLKNGTRQITAILVPGDVCDLAAVLCGRADYAVGVLTRCTFECQPGVWLKSREALGGDLMAAMFTHMRRDEAIAREWLVGLGRRTAVERLAHLFCELRTRLAVVGLAGADSYELQLTQDHVADALGLTNVHVNRALKQLREDGLMTFRAGLLVMIDRSGLEDLAQFDPGYLQP